MTGSMYAAIAGLKTHMTKMSVIGNNIANVNTAGYKSQRTIFKDAMYTTYSSGSDGTSSVAGRNPSQIGYGSQVSSIDINMSGGTYSPGVSTDCMISGDGFFLVGDKDTTIDASNPNSLTSLNLTRVGDISFKGDGYLSDGSGGVVYGFLCTGYDATGKAIISDQLVPIRLPRVTTTYKDETGAEITKADYDAKADDEKAKCTIETTVAYPTATSEDGTTTIPLTDATGEVDATTGTAAELAFAQMEGISFDSKTGAITGTCKDTGEIITIGYIAIGNVTNPNGLTHDGGFYYKAGSGAGDLQVSLLGGVAADLGISSVNGSLLGDDETASDKMLIGNAGGAYLQTGGLEGSNVDLATEISEMITTQRGYQANTRIITVTDAMLEELVNMKR